MSPSAERKAFLEWYADTYGYVPRHNVLTHQLTTADAVAVPCMDAWMAAKAQAAEAIAAAYAQGREDERNGVARPE